MTENVLLVTIDSLRYDRVLGDGRPDVAPTITELAAEGASFSQAFANGPNTPSSFSTILTSTHPLLYGGYRYLDERRPFVSATLQDAGFRTVGYHSNPHLGPEKNYNHGFDTFNDGAESDDDARSLKNFVDEHLDPDGFLYSLLRRGYHMFQMTADTSAYAKAPEITDRAISWFDEDWDGDQPYFMWLHYMDVHYPFTPPDRHVEAIGGEPLSRRRIADLNGRMQEDPESLDDDDVDDLLTLYDGEIRFMDHQLGKLFDAMETESALADTTVVVTADHGEAFGEHDRFGHHPYLYDELLHVPLVVSGPGVPSVSVDQQVSLVDIGPTIYDLVGVETPETVQGDSLEPLLQGGSRETEVAICTANGGDKLACRTPDWKCFWRVDDDEVELYDLMNDPGETKNVVGDNPDVVEELKGYLESYLEEAEATDTELPSVEESDEVKQRLEELGYVD